ncbi:MAG: ParB/RepB/Spo0J family partition protein [Patescibacteria group bacterium]|mgnify:FL=1
MKKISGLGRGLASLIPSRGAVKVVPKTKEDNVYNVEIHKIRPNANQPRREFDQGALQELAGSIKKYGILQPIVVSKVAQETDRGLDVDYEIIAGERRWRAAKIAGLPHIPVIVRDDLDESRMRLEVALVENLQRKDLNVLEEAEAYARLASDFDLTQQQIAEKVGKSREVVANAVRLINLPANIKEAIRSGKIERTQARALLAFKEADKQQDMFKQILAGKADMRNLEETARMIHGGRGLNNALNPKFVQLQDNLAKTLGTFVAIRSRDNGGRIEIKFATLEELNKIAKAILD